MQNGIVCFSNRAMRRKNARISRKKSNRQNVRTPDKSITPPPILSLTRAPDLTRKFLHDVRRLADDRSSGKKRRVDLTGLQEIDLDAALALVAELDRWQRLKGVYLNAETVHTWEKSIVSKLYSLGFFSLLKTDLSNFSIEKKQKHWLPFISSTKTIGYAAKKLRIALNRVMNGADHKYILPIYDPLIESMKNAIEHAYTDAKNDISSYPLYGKRWWMTGVYDEVRHCVDIVFLDLGLTIPTTLPNSRDWKTLQNDPVYGTKLHYDSVRTRAAMLYGFSQTGQYQRGKGFGNIVAPAYQHPKNSVIVISRKAHCLVIERDVCIGAECNVPFAGTLIKWHINLPMLDSKNEQGERTW